MITRDELIAWAKRRFACKDAVEWLEQQPADATMEQLWKSCPEASWLGWLLKTIDFKPDLTAQEWGRLSLEQSILVVRLGMNHEKKAMYDILTEAGKHLVNLLERQASPAASHHS